MPRRSGHPRPRRGAGPPGPRRSSLLFVLKLAAVFVVGLLLLERFPQVEAASARATASALASLLGGLGAAVTRSGATIGVGGTTVEIVADCSPVLPILLLWSAIAAFPASLARKGYGLAASAAALWALNLIRILALIAILEAAPGLFDLLHVYLWQVVTSAAVFGIFIAWAASARRHEEPAR